jgi:hypothetical protein
MLQMGRVYQMRNDQNICRWRKSRRVNNFRLGASYRPHQFERPASKVASTMYDPAEFALVGPPTKQIFILLKKVRMLPHNM